MQPPTPSPPPCSFFLVLQLTKSPRELRTKFSLADKRQEEENRGNEEENRRAGEEGDGDGSGGECVVVGAAKIEDGTETGKKSHTGRSREKLERWMWKRCVY